MFFTRISDRETHTLEEVMKEFQESAVEDCQLKLVIFRSSVLDSALRALTRKSVNLKSKLFIKFSGEIGEDHGGPRREFFR